MPQVFRRRANDLTVVLLYGAALVVVLVILAVAAISRSPYTSATGFRPEQPVPFSHKHHVGGLGIDCRYCHTSVEQSRFAGIPSTETCMTCHSQLWTNAEMLEPVRESLETGRPLRWKRVHNLADFAYFDHQVHVNNGVSCETCHGRVDRMPLMEQAKPLTMKWCIDCHRDPGPHLRPPDAITTMGHDPKTDDIPAHELIRFYDMDTDRLTECYTCHR